VPGGTEIFQRVLEEAPVGQRDAGTRIRLLKEFVRRWQLLPSNLQELQSAPIGLFNRFPPTFGKTT